MMPDSYSALESLRKMLTVRREELKERMANGLETEDSYRVQVGRCKELRDTIEKIGKQIRSLNGDDDDENRPKPSTK